MVVRDSSGAHKRLEFRRLELFAKFGYIQIPIPVYAEGTMTNDNMGCRFGALKSIYE